MIGLGGILCSERRFTPNRSKDAIFSREFASGRARPTAVQRGGQSDLLSFSCL